MESMNVFNKDFHKVISESVHSVLLESGNKDDCPENDNLSCSYCRVKFSDSQNQKDHYKLDWHRYNLKQSLMSKPPITKEEFGEKIDNDDLSSISRSDTEKEDTLDTITQGKIFLQTLSSDSSVEAGLNRVGELEDIYLTSSNEEINVRDSLQEFEDTLTPRLRKTTAKKEQSRKSKTKKLNEEEMARKKDVLQTLIKGDLEKLNKLLINYLRMSEENDKNSFVNEALDKHGNTSLHIAALNKHKEILRYLLYNEADPYIKNKYQKTAYTCTQSKEIREMLKQFISENCYTYNCNKANIPTNRLTEVVAEKKIQKKIKKEKEKEKKKEKEQKEREKRVWAASWRIMCQSGSVTARCFLCALDISQKVPVEYSGNRFCSIECLKAYKITNPNILS